MATLVVASLVSIYMQAIQTPVYADVTGNTGNNLHETHYYGFFARDVSDMGYQPGGELMASLLRSLHICKNYRINAKYMIKDIYDWCTYHYAIIRL